VDDITGFTTVLVNGVVTPISGSATITVAETAMSASGVTQTLTVTGFVADATNQSSSLVGVSGTLTFTAGPSSPINGDAIVSALAPKVIRPFSRSTTAALQNSDMLSMGLIEDCVAYLRDNGVPPMEDGTHHCILDNTSLRQLFADQDFKVLFAGSQQAKEYRDGDIIRLLGITFIPTTETLIQPANTQYNGAAYNAASTATSPSNVAVRVRRPIVLGAESIIQGDFEGLETWLDRQGVNAIGDVFLVNGVAQILRPPLDRLQQWASLTWTWIGDFSIPTDVTATSSIIPTASNAAYKRAVTIEHAG
jgi:hypothetical protein